MTQIIGNVRDVGGGGLTGTVTVWSGFRPEVSSLIAPRRRRWDITNGELPADMNVLPGPVVVELDLGLNAFTSFEADVPDQETVRLKDLFSQEYVWHPFVISEVFEYKNLAEAAADRAEAAAADVDTAIADAADQVVAAVEDDRVAAEAARVAAEAARDAALASESAVADSAVAVAADAAAAAAARFAAEEARDSAAGARDGALASETAAGVSAGAASDSADAAGVSAGVASSAADTATAAAADAALERGQAEAASQDAGEAREDVRRIRDEDVLPARDAAAASAGAASTSAAESSTARDAAQTAQQVTEDARGDTYTARDAAQAAQQVTEDARDDTYTARDLAQQAQSGAEDERVVAEDAASVAGGHAQAADGHRIDAEAAAALAQSLRWVIRGAWEPGDYEAGDVVVWDERAYYAQTGTSVEPPDQPWVPLTPAGGGGASHWDDLDGKPVVFPPEAHTHDAADVSGAATPILDVTEASVGAQSVGEAIESKADIGHTHTIGDTDGLQAALDGRAATGHTHTWSQISDAPSYSKDMTGDHLVQRSASGHINVPSGAGPLNAVRRLDVDAALAGKSDVGHTHPVTDLTATGTRSASTYLRGDGSWATPTNTTYSVPSQAEAEAGTATTARAFSAQRVRQAIDARAVANEGNANGLWIGTTANLPSSGSTGVLYVTTD